MAVDVKDKKGQVSTLHEVIALPHCNLVWASVTREDERMLLSPTVDFSCRYAWPWLRLYGGVCCVPAVWLQQHSWTLSCAGVVIDSIAAELLRQSCQISLFPFSKACYLGLSAILNPPIWSNNLPKSTTTIKTPAFTMQAAHQKVAELWRKMMMIFFNQ